MRLVGGVGVGSVVGASIFRTFPALLFLPRVRHLHPHSEHTHEQGVNNDLYGVVLLKYEPLD